MVKMDLIIIINMFSLGIILIALIIPIDILYYNISIINNAAAIASPFFIKINLFARYLSSINI